MGNAGRLPKKSPLKGEINALPQVTGVVNPRVRVTASGQERLYSPFLWVSSSFSRSAAELLEGRGSRAGPTQPYRQ